MHLDNTTARRYRDALGGAATSDLLAALAALQLVPDNSRFIARLEAAIQLVVQLPTDDPSRPLTQKRIRDWLEHSPFASYDDPLNTTFTEETMFFGGSYVVFPGPVEQALFVFRHLTQAIFLGDAWHEARGERRQAANLIGAGLRLSHAVAGRLGLTRGLPAKGRRDLSVPGTQVLTRAAQAMRFDSETLDELLGSLGGREALAPLLRWVEPVPDANDFGSNDFVARPLVALDEGGVLIALPHELLPALNHAVVSLFVDAGLSESLATRFRAAVYARVAERLGEMGWRQVAVPIPPEPNELPGFSSIWQFDTDKLAHVLLLTDDLAAYDRSDIFGAWNVPRLNEMVEERLDDVERALYAASPAPNDVIHLVVLESFGRWQMLGLGERPPDLPGKVVFFNADDLEVISLLYHDQLTIWKYAVAHDRVRQHTRIMAFSALDEFDLYRSRDHSYYLSDDPRPNLISISPDGAAALKALVQDRYDFHGAWLPGRRAITTVALVHGERRIPIYARFSRRYRYPQILVEGFDVPLWVVADEIPESRYLPLAFQHADLVAYWLWQLTPGLERLGMAPRANERGELIVRIRLTTSDSWFERHDQPFEGSVVAQDANPEVVVTFGPGFITGLGRRDNLADREVVRQLLLALRESSGGQVTDAQVDKLVDATAPVGLKKKADAVDSSEDPRLSDQGLPDFRGVQEADEAQLLDDLGEYLVGAGFPEGPLDNDGTTRALHAAVAYYFDRLEKTVASLAPDGLLEWLIASNDAIVAHQALRDRAVPTELECFADVPTTVERLEKEIPSIARAAIASRFLIEYTAARPPRGIRPLSQQLYDELLVVASDIFNKGLISDAIYYRLANPEVSILPSHRLGIERGTRFDVGRDAYLQLHARSEITRRRRRFVATRAPSSDEPEGIGELDEAVAEEFGLSLREFIDFHAELINAGSDRDGEPKVARLEDLKRELRVALVWEAEKIDRAFDLHSLKPRARYMDPPDGFSKTELFPWAFNRSLSFIRRPLVFRERDNEIDVVWGIRHVYTASRHFFDLSTGGRLRATTPRLKQAIDSWRQRDAREFNNRVAALYEGHGDLLVRVRVKKIGRLRIERSRGQDLSDIDVLVADRRRRQLIVIETKALVVGRTAVELRNEQIDTFEGRPGKRSEVEKLVELDQWVTARRREVLEHLGLNPSNAKRWRVFSFMVVENELLSPFLLELPVPVLSFHDLEERVAQRQLS